MLPCKVAGWLVSNKIEDLRSFREELTAPTPAYDMLATGHLGAIDSERQDHVHVTHKSRDTVNTGGEKEDG